MERFTIRDKNGRFIVEADKLEAAVRRLAEFENAYDALIERQKQIPLELEQLRAQGKDKTVRYKETLAQKLVHNSIAGFFERHGIK